MTFVDTSALFAIIDADDARHDDASRTLEAVLERRDQLVTTRYTEVEAFALAQARLGMRSVSAVEDLLNAMRIERIEDTIHAQAKAMFLAQSRRKLSFVDCTSFAFMRASGILRAFAFDAHFTEFGFTLA